MNMLSRPDDRTKTALARLRGDSDFQEVLAWLQHSMFELDRRQRIQSDGVMLRQGQGAAQAIAELVDYAHGKKEQAIAIAERELRAPPAQIPRGP